MASLLVTGCSLGKSGDQESSAPGVTNAKKVASNYDVIVVGGDPEGISAAVSAARNGQKNPSLVRI